jgi:hypothetical protein
MACQTCLNRHPSTTVAAELVHSTDPADQHHAATRRILDHYLHTAHHASLLLHPTRDRIALIEACGGITPEHLTNYERALAWFTTEHPVLLAVVNHAAAIGLDTHSWQLAWVLADFLYRRGHWRDVVATQHAAVAATERLADPAAAALTHRFLARGYTFRVATTTPEPISSTPSTGPIGPVTAGHQDGRASALNSADRLGDRYGLAETPHPPRRHPPHHRRYSGRPHRLATSSCYPRSSSPSRRRRAPHQTRPHRPTPRARHRRQ